MLVRKGILTPTWQVVEQMKKIAASYNLPFGELKKSYNSRLMQEVGLWAQENGKGPAFQAEGFKAYFVDNENIADTEVLLNIIQKVNLNPVKGKTVIVERLYSDAVETDWSAGERLEIVAAPTYIVNSERLVGAQPYQELEKLVTRNGAKQKIS